MGERGDGVAVVGLWHLGSVISACLAEAGYSVVATDPDPDVVTALADGRPPVAEPGLGELIHAQLERGHLRFEPAGGSAFQAAPTVWITFDTPVDEDDAADVEWVLDESARTLEGAAPDAFVVVSAQLPVGSVARLAQRLREAGRADLGFACVPENLRLGAAIDTFRAPERFVAGVAGESGRERVAALLEPFGAPVEWMSIESAEMTKHALNGFLATSVAYINEVAAICEAVGADASEVARGLKSERRIGPRAYLGPGDVFAGGTLGRDVTFLSGLAREHRLPSNLVDGVWASNESHREWADRTLQELSDGQLDGRRVCLLGLAYKPGTDTLRRSSALALGLRLADQGAEVVAHDPAVASLPEDEQRVVLSRDPLEAARGAHALVVCTTWPEYRDLDVAQIVEAMADPVVIDASGFLQEVFSHRDDVRYMRVGSPRP